MGVSDNLLTVRNLHTYYGDSHILQGISLSVPQGQVVTILGRNGMGKTTLIRSITGMTPPRQGEILLLNRQITHLRSYQIAQLGIGLIPQGRRLFGSLTVKENLQVPTSWLARLGAQRNDSSGRGLWTLAMVLDLFPHLQARLHNRARTLSGGEQQMLAIGRALMCNPQILLMDEPSEGLAPRMVSEVKRIILKLKERGQSILLVEQNLHLAEAVADTIYIMANGQIVYEGSASDLQQRADIRAIHLGV